MLVPILLAITVLPAGGTSLRFDGGSVELDGPWQFHLGDDARWASPNVDDSNWEKLSPNRPWGAQGHPNTDGFGWYRYHVSLDHGQNNPDQVVVMFPLVEDVFQVYWNGHLIGGHGQMPPHAKWYGEPQPQQYALGAASSGVLAVRVWKAPFVSYDNGVQGGIRMAPVLGDPATIQAQAESLLYWGLRGHQLSNVLLPVYGIVALLGLMVWWRDRSVPVGLCLAVLAAEQPLVYFSGFLVALRSLAVASFIEPCSSAAMYVLLAWLLGLREDPRVYRWTKIIALTEVVLSLADVCTDPGFLSKSPWPWQMADLCLSYATGLCEFLPFVLIGIAIARHKRLDASRWTVAILAFVSQGSIMLGWFFLQGVRFTHWTIGQYLQAPLFVVHGNAVDLPTLSRVLFLIALGWATYRYSEDSRREQQRLELELRAARAVQQVLVPRSIPQVHGFQVSSVYLPAGHVGGDFFQILPTAEGDVLIVIGDVSGKGVPAALTVSLLVGAVRTLADSAPGPGTLLSRLNHLMTGRTEGGFTTCLIVRADRSGKLTVANAGHLSPYVNGHEVDTDNGLPLGISRDTSYPETVLHLSESDQLTLLTDGVVEARNSQGELFGFERTATVARGTAQQVANAAQCFGQDDDITVLTLARAAEVSSPASTFVGIPQHVAGSSA